MACEDAWKIAWELATASSKALQEMLSVKPYTDLGRVVAMTEEELAVTRAAEEKYVAAEQAWQKAAMEAARLNELHFS
jgi:hypothetical protein